MVMRMIGHSSATIVDYFGHFRQLVVSALDEEDTLIGGPGTVIQVDESKFGKRKNNRGRRVNGAWVIGGVEQNEERKFFVAVVDRRDQETIIDVLSRHVLPGSIVYTDCWRGYVGIEEALNVSHQTVNHSLYFVDPNTGVHTQSIEAKWAALKQKITLRGRVERILPNYLLEQVWRFKNRLCLWKAFLAALAEVYYE
jgi:transposase-like protein